MIATDDITKELFSACFYPINSPRKNIAIKIFKKNTGLLYSLADIGLYNRPAKFLRGYTAKKFFEYFPELKRQKHQVGLFWDSGLWNSSYWIDSPRNFENTIKYIKKQKYGELGRTMKSQTILLSF